MDANKLSLLALGIVLVGFLLLLGFFFFSGERLLPLGISTHSENPSYDLAVNNDNVVKGAVESSPYLSDIRKVRVSLVNTPQPQLQLISKENGVVYSGFNYEQVGGEVQVKIHLSGEYFDIDSTLPLEAYQEPSFYTLVAISQLEAINSNDRNSSRLDFIADTVRKQLVEMEPAEYPIIIKMR